jgi:vacuolar protein sorting-associated protein IST1
MCLVRRECSEEIREAAAGVIFAAKWCSDLPELQLTRDILADKFGNEFAAQAKEGTAFVDPAVRIPILHFRTSVDRFGVAKRKCDTDMLGLFRQLPLQLVWKLSGDTANMELKKKVTKAIAAENNISVDFS